MPLSSEEIRAGIVAQLKADGVSEQVLDSIRTGLSKTCSLNRQCYAKFGAKWSIGKGNWTLAYELDDFGRINRGNIGGIIADVELEQQGQIDPMPPDTFRRRTEQPIPSPRIVKKKADDGVGITKAYGSRGGKRKMT
jgi:hypothetical protein